MMVQCSLFCVFFYQLTKILFHLCYGLRKSLSVQIIQKLQFIFMDEGRSSRTQTSWPLSWFGWSATSSILFLIAVSTKVCSIVVLITIRQSYLQLMKFFLWRSQWRVRWRTRSVCSISWWWCQWRNRPAPSSHVFSDIWKCKMCSWGGIAGRRMKARTANRAVRTMSKWWWKWRVWSARVCGWHGACCGVTSTSFARSSIEGAWSPAYVTTTAWEVGFWTP